MTVTVTVTVTVCLSVSVWNVWRASWHVFAPVATVTCNIVKVV